MINKKVCCLCAETDVLSLPLLRSQRRDVWTIESKVDTNALYFFRTYDIPHASVTLVTGYVYFYIKIERVIALYRPKALGILHISRRDSYF